jgi:hypothetical protein
MSALPTWAQKALTGVLLLLGVPLLSYVGARVWCHEAALAELRATQDADRAYLRSLHEDVRETRREVREIHAALVKAK